MSEILTIRTLFADVAELADGFVDRVSPGQLTLPASEPVEEGEWSQFVVALRDGTPAFAGVGCCIAATDLGPDAPAEARYELVFDSLKFEEDSNAVFEHLVLVSETSRESGHVGVGAYPGDVHTADVSDSEVQEIERAQADAVLVRETFQDVRDSELQEFVPERPMDIVGAQDMAPQDAQDIGPDPIGVDVSMSSEAPEGPEPVTLWPDSLKETILSRPLVAGSWIPRIGARPEPRASSGLFLYNGDGLPQPARPPRPDLEPSLWVTPAPHPRDPKPAVKPGQAPQASLAEQAAFDAMPSIPVEATGEYIVPSSLPVEATGEYVAPAAQEASAGLAADAVVDPAEQAEPPPIPDEASDAGFLPEAGTAELAESELEELVESEAPGDFEDSEKEQ